MEITLNTVFFIVISSIFVTLNTQHLISSSGGSRGGQCGCADLLFRKFIAKICIKIKELGLMEGYPQHLLGLANVFIILFFFLQCFSNF